MVGVIVFLLIHALFGQAMVNDITNEKLDSGMDPAERSSTMFSKEDFPFSHFIIYDPSITINMVFTRDESDKEGEGSLEVLVFEKESYGRFIGSNPPSKDTKIIYCCTKDRKQNNECDDKKIGEVIRRPQEQIHDYKIHFLSTNFSGTIDVEIPINTTGTFVVLIFNCHDNGVGNVIVKGSVIWKNPFGFLPGDYYMKLLHYGVLALLYMLVNILFSILCIKYRHILMKIQYGILGLVAFTLIEEAAWYFYLLGTNKTGIYNISALLFVVFLTNVKQTLVFVLVLFVSMGLGIVKWTLGTTRYKIGFLAVFHLFLWFLILSVNEAIELNDKKEPVVDQWVSLALIIPAAILTTGFFYWIFLSIIRTMQQLTLRRQVLKLEMYKTFFGVLVICVILAALIILYWSYSRVAGVIPWQKKWIIGAFKDFLFFIILASLAFLWRPRLNNTRYGYAEFFTDEENDGGGDIAVPLETVNVISGSSMTHRKTNKERVVENKANEKYDGDRTKNLEKLKLTPFERDIVEFDLPSDDEDEISIDTQLKKME